MDSSEKNATKKSSLEVDPNPVIPSFPPQAPLRRFPLAPFQMRFSLKEAFLALSTSSIQCSCLCSSFLFFSHKHPSCFVSFFVSFLPLFGMDLICEDVYSRVYSFVSSSVFLGQSPYPTHLAFAFQPIPQELLSASIRFAARSSACLHSNRTLSIIPRL